MMQNVFKKIIERLEEEGEKHLELSKAHELGIYEQNRQKEIACVYGHSIRIVNQVAEEYGDKTTIDGQYCWQTCACTEMCDKCNRLSNGEFDYYENI